MTILIAGGGTAGHVFPALAVGEALANLGRTPAYVGTPQHLEGRLVPEAGFNLHEIEMLPVPRRPSLSLLRLPFVLRRAIGRCVEIAEQNDAEAAITFGGYVSYPLAAAASRLGLPLIVHEQNSVPGLANRFAARWADRVAASFPGSVDRFPRSERVAVTGNPVRSEILALDVDARRDQALEHFGLARDRRTLLVFGGSQGARRINEAAIASFTLWRSPERIQILHAAGRSHHRAAAAQWENARRAGKGPRVRCIDFIDRMEDAYAVADVVLCRAGATSIAELTVLGKPAVLVPYPHATRDHQLHNAAALRQTGAASLVLDNALDGHTLVDAVEPLLEDDELHETMATAARAFGRPDAAENVARLMLSLLEDGGVS